MQIYINNFLKYKDLLLELIRKDIKLKYKNSFLGIIWSLLNPLLMMIVLTIIFSELFKRNIENFPVYVLIGRLLYTFFSESTSFAMDSIVVNSSLIRKVYVPKYFFPIARVGSSLIITLIAMSTLVIVMIVTGISFSFVNLLIIFPLIYLFLTSLGIGLILATINVFFRDIKHLYSVILMIVMYTTPIFYPADIIPEKFRSIIELNPLFHIVEMSRDVLMYHSIPALHDHVVSIGYSLVYFLIGGLVFYKYQDKFINHL